MQTIAPMAVIAIPLAMVSCLSTGCETAAQDLAEVFDWNTPSPTQASAWMFHRDPERRRTGIALISNAYFGGEEPYLKVYREAVTDADPMVRAASARALGMHGQPEDAPLLATVLKDSSNLARWEAAKGLQRLHNPAVVGALIESATSDEDLDVRMASANALGQYRQRRVIEALIRALDDRSVGVALHALRSLRILTGEQFNSDPVVWLEWSRQVDDPFANGRTYTYPVYTRSNTFLEKVLPVGKPVFEEPGVPVGLEESATTAAQESPAS